MAIAPVTGPNVASITYGGHTYANTDAGRNQMRQDAQNGVIASGPGGTGVENAIRFASGGSVSPSSSGGGGGGQGFNQAAAQLAAQLADNSAQMAYYNARLNLDSEDLAFRKAQQAWTETYQRAGLTGMLDGQQTLAAQKQQTDETQSYLGLLAGLRGPANAFKYAQVLQSTPGGLRDIVNAAAGRYMMSGFGGGAAPSTGNLQPASLQSLIQDATTGGAGIPTDVPALPLPNQINARNYNLMTPTQKQLLLGSYEQAGYDPQDVQAQYLASLPKYVFGTGAGRINLGG